jgi:predicted site-specific integrase-resolvase
MIKLTKLAKDLGVTRATIYNWYNKGMFEFIKSETNRNFVSLETYNSLLGIKQTKEEKVVIYCRVSSSENKSNLDTQKERLVSYCNARGYKVDKIITEIGSGVNDNRPKLIKLLSDNDYTKIVVEHKDRLTRFGFNYFEVFTKVLNKEIEVVNNISSPEEDIVQDFISIITSFCSRIYGKRRSKRKTEQIIKELNS